MFERNLANKLKGWNTISDISKKLNVKKTTAYFYVHRLDKKGFVIQKIKKPRGTMYLIDPIPISSKNQGMLSGSDILSSEIEFSSDKIPAEHKIAYFLKKSKEENNLRYKEQSKKIIRSITNWKKLYRYLKTYGVVEDFKTFYLESRKEVKKIPSMPKRYKKLMGV